MEKVFISYRRDDSAGYVMSLRSEMNRRFGDQQVFIDVEDIPAGSDFVKVIENTVGNCEALLAIIGPFWLKVTNSHGQRRLDDPLDFVRIEIGSALRRGIPVIPVLVGDTDMPAEDDLPIDLKPLTRIQGTALSNKRWDEDVGSLFQALERLPSVKLSRQYVEALDALKEGRWEEALRIFDTIRPGYQDIRDRIQPLRKLAQATEGLGPAPHGWRNAVFRFPVFTLVLLSVLPNGLAALFNFFYNWRMIVMPLQEQGVDQAERLFQYSAMIVNSTFFPLGMGLFVWLVWPASRVWRQLRSGVAVSLDTLKTIRDRCLNLGHFAAIIGGVLWAVAGPVYPVMVGALGPLDYVYFIVSLIMCGVIAATYPFLAVAWLCTRVLYLPLVLPGSTTLEDEAALERLGRWSWRYLLMAGTLPLLAITLGLSLSPLARSAGHSTLLGLLGVGGIGGFVLAIQLFRSIQRNLLVLQQAVEHSRPRNDD
jgi:TIR domain